MVTSIKRINVSLEEVSEMLKSYKELDIKYIVGKPVHDECVGSKVYIWESPTHLHIIDRYGKRTNKTTEYVFAYDGTLKADLPEPGRCFAIMQKKCHILDLEGKYKDLSSSPLIWHRYDSLDVDYAIAYDINKAYFNAMKNDMPDTSVKPRMGFVEANEIGFRMGKTIICNDPDTNTSVPRIALVMVKEGGYADYIFPKMPTMFTPYITHMLNKFKECEKIVDEKERKEVKGIIKYSINASVGCIQNHNPFIRAAIVGYATQYIESLINDDTVYVNTDCIISTCKRDDIPIGNEIGQFKIEDEGVFHQQGANYCFEGGKISHRGPQVANNIYKMEWENLKIRRI